MLRSGSVVFAFPRVIRSCAFALLPSHPLATALLRGRPPPSQTLNHLCRSVSNCADCFWPFDVPPFFGVPLPLLGRPVTQASLSDFALFPPPTSSTTPSYSYRLTVYSQCELAGQRRSAVLPTCSRCTDTVLTSEDVSNSQFHRISQVETHG